MNEKDLLKMILTQQEMINTQLDLIEQLGIVVEKQGETLGIHMELIQKIWNVMQPESMRIQ
jgi:hypothetical protein